jgi:hypothetical protein
MISSHAHYSVGTAGMESERHDQHSIYSIIQMQQEHIVLFLSMSEILAQQQLNSEDRDLLSTRFML